MEPCLDVAQQGVDVTSFPSLMMFPCQTSLCSNVQIWLTATREASKVVIATFLAFAASCFRFPPHWRQGARCCARSSPQSGLLGGRGGCWRRSACTVMRMPPCLLIFFLCGFMCKQHSDHMLCLRGQVDFDGSSIALEPCAGTKCMHGNGHATMLIDFCFRLRIYAQATFASHALFARPG